MSTRLIVKGERLHFWETAWMSRNHMLSFLKGLGSVLHILFVHQDLERLFFKSRYFEYWVWNAFMLSCHLQNELCRSSTVQQQGPHSSLQDIGTFKLQKQWIQSMCTFTKHKLWVPTLCETYKESVTTHQTKSLPNRIHCSGQNGFFRVWYSNVKQE